MIDLVGGRTNMMFDNLPSALPHAQAGELRAIAVTGAQRSSALPNVPTIAEAGVPGYSTGTWYGLLAPEGTKRAVVDRLSSAAHKAVMAPEVRSRMLDDGAEPVGSSPEAFEKHLASEIAKWKKVVKAAGIAVR